jgi:serine protease Do
MAGVMVRATLVAILAALLVARVVVGSPKDSGHQSFINLGGSAPRNALCTGQYADDLAVMSAKARELDQKPQSQYTRCVRTTAVYECISYGTDGNLRRVRKRAVGHGTAFAYRQQGGETYLLTNQHVVEWPPVTDDEHRVDEIPNGCKRVSDSLRIVDNEADAYERDDIPLTRVVSDPQLDAAVLKAHVALPTMPWKLGRSSALRERNVVDVRGFPLGAFKATTQGKVITAYDHDDEKEWDHDDFVIDALLSPGHSGSPVFAVSCKTGEPELVGIYHAGYNGGSALNVVVGIDQLRDLMTTLKRTPRAKGEAQVDAKARTRLMEDLKSTPEPFFAFGNLTAMVHARTDGALVFEVMSKEFPVKAHPIMAVEDLTGAAMEEFGRLGRVWFGNRQGVKAIPRADLDGDAQAQMTRLLDALRHDAIAAFDYRAAARKATGSREQFDQVSRQERALKRTAKERVELSNTVVDWAERFGPHETDVVLPLSALMSPPTQSTVSAKEPESAPAHAPPAP